MGRWQKSWLSVYQQRRSHFRGLHQSRGTTEKKTTVTTLQASELTLSEVKAKFGLQESQNELFFREWQEPRPKLTETEQRSLDQIKANFLYLSEYPTTEEVVKLVMLSPLLSMAEFYSPPFRIRAEVPVQIALEDGNEVVRGRIDVLVLQDQLWVLVVESKEASFSLKAAIAQSLVYMMTMQKVDQPAFSLVMNGSEFRFLKLIHQSAQYALSDLLTIQRRENDLYCVLSILKQLSKVIQSH
jgi:hypothetical protein